MMTEKAYKKYVIEGLGNPFDGLIVHTLKDLPKHPIPSLVVSVDRLESCSLLFDTWSLPLKEEGLFIRYEYLRPYKEYLSDQLTDNPWGKYICEGKLSKKNVDVTWCMYSSALTVKVVNGESTLYSHNYLDKQKICTVHAFLSDMQFDSDYDWDDLVFDLREYE